MFLNLWKFFYPPNNVPNHYPEHFHLKKTSSEGFGIFFGGWSQSEKLSQIKLLVPIFYMEVGKFQKHFFLIRLKKEFCLNMQSFAIFQIQLFCFCNMCNNDMYIDMSHYNKTIFNMPRYNTYSMMWKKSFRHRHFSCREIPQGYYYCKYSKS